MLTQDNFKKRLLSAATAVADAEDELTKIDTLFGDADHGITMKKIADAISQAVSNSNGTIKSILDDAAMNVLMINGGSAVPLWNTWLDGLQSHAKDENEMSNDDVKKMFKGALDEFKSFSRASVGDKTMLDALEPATLALINADGDIDVLFSKAADAAIQGAEDSKKYISNFGRAKSYGEKTIGTPDAGAVSMKYFFVGLADYKK